MEKWLCLSAIGVSALVLLLFVLDFVAGFPFGGINKIVNVLAILSCAIVCYLGWDAYKDQV